MPTESYRVPGNTVYETLHNIRMYRNDYKGISFFFLLPLLSSLVSAIYSACLKYPPYEMPDDKIRADNDYDNTNIAVRTILTRSRNGHFRYCTTGARDKALSCPDTR